MKTPIRYVLLLLAALLSSAVAADAVRIEIRGDSIKVEGHTTVAKGNAVAVVANLRISAEQIVADGESGELKCLGETTIMTTEILVRTRDATIETKPKVPTAPLPTRKIRDLPTL